MTLIQLDPDWLIELLKQNRSISIHDGLNTFVQKTNNGWKICGRNNVISLLIKRTFNDLSSALVVAKSLKNKLAKSKTTNTVACVRHKNGWCACAGTTIRYRDQVRTKCNHIVILPSDLKFRQPTCYKCIKALCK